MNTDDKTMLSNFGYPVTEMIENGFAPEQQEIHNIMVIKNISASDSVLHLASAFTHK